MAGSADHEPEARRGALIGALEIAAVAAALLYVLLYLLIAVLRIDHPYDLEWMEGGMVDHVGRILGGEKLYVEPSVAFTTFIYAPLYYYGSALLALLLGPGHLPLRILSFAASLGSLLIVYRMVLRESASKLSGLLAIGVFAATFRLGGAWFDLARTDSLYLFLLLATFYALRFHATRMGFAGASLLLALAFLTKQSALVALLPLGAYVFFVYGWLGLWFVVPFAVLVGLSTVLLDLVHAGWYWYYVFELPSHHPLEPSHWIGFWTVDILKPLPIATAMAAAFLGLQFVRRNTRCFVFYLAVAAALFGAAWSGRLHTGGYDNVLIPAHVALAIFFGLAIQPVMQLAASAPRARRQLFQAGFLLACIGQFALLAYDPRPLVPGERDRAAGDELVATLEAIEGSVFTPSMGYLAERVDKQPHAHAMAILDVLRGPAAERKILLDDLEREIAEKRFAALILPDLETLQIGEVHIPDYYRPEGTLFDDDDLFRPVTGARHRPQYLFVPK